MVEKKGECFWHRVANAPGLKSDDEWQGEYKCRNCSGLDFECEMYKEDLVPKEYEL